MPQPTTEELTERLCQATDGISIALADGTEPTDGYMVSLHGYELRIGPHLRWQRLLIQAWLTAAETVKSRHHGIFVGRWTDENGSVYLDLSVRCLTAPAAYRLAVANKQKAIYDVAKGETLNVS